MKKKVIKAWAILPITGQVSRDGWTFFDPIFLRKRNALQMASKELVVPVEITYQVKPKRK